MHSRAFLFNSAVFGKRIRYVVGIVIVTCLGACAESRIERSDPEGRIAYSVPAEWEPKSGSNGTRYAIEGAPASTSIQINTVPVGGQSLEQERDAWLAGQTKNGARVLSTDEWESGGFLAVEYAHTAKSALDVEVVWHHVLMVNDDTKVAAALMAPVEDYEHHLPVFKEILHSVRVVRATP